MAPVARNSKRSMLSMESSGCKVRKTEKEDESKGEKDLLLVYEELDISEKSKRALLVELGIKTIGMLFRRKAALKAAELSPVKKATQKRLYVACLCYEDYCKNHAHRLAWQNYFNEESLSRFEERAMTTAPVITSATEVPVLFGHIVNTLHAEDKGPLSSVSEEKLQMVYSYAAEVVLNKLPKPLKDNCNFPLEKSVIGWVKAVINLPAEKHDPVIMGISGRTQSGKSNVKAVLHCVCQLLTVPVYVITKGVMESKDLAKKIPKLLQDDAPCPFRTWWKIDGNGPTVIADTAAQLSKVVEKFNAMRLENPGGKFVVIVDESDAMYRTQERGQKMEQAFDELMDLDPVLRVEISASIIPTLLTFMDEDGECPNVSLMELGTSADYCGIESMVALQGANGKPCHLIYNDIKYDVGVPHEVRQRNLNLLKQDTMVLFTDAQKENPKCSDCQKVAGCRKHSDSIEPNWKWPSGDLNFIPYTDAKMTRLYDDAVSDLDKKKGVLLLDASAPRVNVECNIFEKAVCVQNRYRGRGVNIIIIICVGSGTFFRCPGYSRGRFVRNKITVSELIEQLDKKFGLEMPIFVFGYAKMRRCISYRSEKRVPTHMAVVLGAGYSNESYIQVIGRATYNGLDTLKENGHKNVTILTSADDFKMANKYSKFLEVMHRQIEAGATFAEALKGTKEKFPDYANFLRHTNRKTGQIKDLNLKGPSQDRFHDPDDEDFGGEEDKIQRYWNDEKAQRVMHSILYLQEEEQLQHYTVDDILDKYNDTYNDSESVMKKAELKKILTRLKNDVILEKKRGTDAEPELWLAKKMPVLSRMLNREFS